MWQPLLRFQTGTSNVVWMTGPTLNQFLPVQPAFRSPAHLLIPPPTGVLPPLIVLGPVPALRVVSDLLAALTQRLVNPQVELPSAHPTPEIVLPVVVTAERGEQPDEPLGLYSLDELVIVVPDAGGVGSAATASASTSGAASSSVG